MRQAIELRGDRRESIITSWFLFEGADTLTVIARRDPESAALRRGLETLTAAGDRRRPGRRRGRRHGPRHRPAGALRARGRAARAPRGPLPACPSRHRRTASRRPTPPWPSSTRSSAASTPLASGSGAPRRGSPTPAWMRLLRPSRTSAPTPTSSAPEPSRADAGDPWGGRLKLSAETYSSVSDPIFADELRSPLQREFTRGAGRQRHSFRALRRIGRVAPGDRLDPRALRRSAHRPMPTARCTAPRSAPAASGAPSAHGPGPQASRRSAGRPKDGMEGLPGRRSWASRLHRTVGSAHAPIGGPSAQHRCRPER